MITSDHFLRRTLVLFLLCVIPSAVSISFAGEGSHAEAKEACDLADGTYEGYCRRALGMANVKVTIQDGDIADIEVVSRFCSPWGRKAFEQMPDRIIESQKVDVDAVTGATYSSSTIKAAVEDALRKARAAVGDDS